MEFQLVIRLFYSLLQQAVCRQLTCKSLQKQKFFFSPLRGMFLRFILWALFKKFMAKIIKQLKLSELEIHFCLGD